MNNVLQERMRLPRGFIDAYMHFGSPTFTKLGEGEKQGYYTIPKDTVQSELHIQNLIVNNASLFMTKRMLPGVSWGSGIGFLEVGTGVGTGTTASPQVEDPNKLALRVPLIRKAIGSWTYLDSGNLPTVTETNVVKLTTIFIESEANGNLVEMGLSGGDATVTIGSGYMFNYKTFPVWPKTSALQLTVDWRLIF